MISVLGATKEVKDARETGRVTIQWTKNQKGAFKCRLFSYFICQRFPVLFCFEICAPEGERREGMQISK